jgi:hypothetical protein
MRKFKINTSKSNLEPTQEQILRYKNFNALSQNHKKISKRPKKALYRDPKMFLFIILIGLIALLLFS